MHMHIHVLGVTCIHTSVCMHAAGLSVSAPLEGLLREPPTAVPWLRSHAAVLFRRGLACRVQGGRRCQLHVA